MPFFYEENTGLNNSAFILSEDTSKHCVQVLRMKVGEQLELTNGLGVIVTAEIVEANKKACAVKPVAKKEIARPERKITIAMSLLKNAARFEWFLEKAAEIGVTEIIPLLCARTERQHFRFDRMQGILVSAMLQSQQAWLPVLHQPTAVEKVIAGAANAQRLIAHCLKAPKQTLLQVAPSNDVLMLIGPEGDFTEQEINDSLIKGFTPVTLGNTRLRTETAGITAAVLLANK